VICARPPATAMVPKLAANVLGDESAGNAHLQGVARHTTKLQTTTYPVEAVCQSGWQLAREKSLPPKVFRVQMRIRLIFQLVYQNDVCEFESYMPSRIVYLRCPPSLARRVNEIVCPYCSTLVRFDPSLGAHEADPADCAYGDMD
jgi:hypothetical protein